MTVCAKLKPFWAGTLALLASPALAMAAEGESLTQFDRWYNALWALGIFVVLLAVLSKLAWKPLMRVIADREESIKATLREAELRHSESERLMKQYRGQLEKAQDEISGMMAEAAHRRGKPPESAG